MQQPVTFYSGPEASRRVHGLYILYSALRFLRLNPPPKSRDHFRLITKPGEQRGESTNLGLLIGMVASPADLLKLFVRSREFDELVIKTERLALILSPREGHTMLS